MSNTPVLTPTASGVLSQAQPPAAQPAHSPWNRARAILTSMARDGARITQPWAELCLTADGDYAHYLEELDVLWRHAEEHGDIALAFRCALQAASVRSLRWDVPPPLLAQLAVVGTPVGRWGAPALARAIARMPGPAGQAQAIAALAPHSGHVADLLLAAARQIDDAEARADALIALIPQLPPDQGSALGDEVLACIRGVGHASTRAALLYKLAQALPQTLRAAALDAALAATRAVGDAAGRMAALTQLLPLLETEQRTDAHARAMRCLAKVESDWRRAMLLADLLPHTPPEQRGAALAKALRYARQTRNREHHTLALIAIAHHAPPEQRDELLGDALAETHRITHPHRAATLLAKLCPLLPPGQQPEVAADMRAKARLIEDGFRRAMLLAEALHTLPAPERPATLDLALACVRDIDSPWLRGLVLLRAATAGPTRQDLLAQALEHARREGSPMQRAELLCDIAMHMPPDARPAALAETLASAQEIGRCDAARNVLAALAAQGTPAPEHSAPIETLYPQLRAMAARGRGALLRDMAALAPWLAASLPPAALEEIARAVEEITACWP